MRASLDEIFSATLDVLECDRRRWEINKRRRNPEMTKIKQMFSCIAYDNGYSLCEIGDFIGFNHATVYHNKTQANWFASHERNYAQVINKIRFVLDNRHSELAKPISKRKAAKIYASIYAGELNATARMSFFDGIMFWDMVKAGIVTDDMINTDFFNILSDNNHASDL